jgi:hypothetical protein
MIVNSPTSKKKKEKKDSRTYYFYFYFFRSRPMGRRHAAKIFLKIQKMKNEKSPCSILHFEFPKKSNKMGEEAPQRWRTFFFAVARALLISLRLCICEQFF